MHNHDRNDNRWLDQHDQSERLQQVLACFKVRGIATCEMIESLTGLSQHPVRDALKILVHPPGGLLPLLKGINVTVPGQRGRPYAAYVLTNVGAANMGEESRGAPKLDNPIEAVHALLEMQVFVAAQLQGHKAELEKVIPFRGMKNIRVDALYEGRVLFEIEQQARVSDIPRITDKLERLTLFFQSPAGRSFDSKVRVIFILATSDGKTIPIWQQVMGALKKKHHNLPFELHWQEINSFLEMPAWEEIESMQLLEPVVQPALDETQEKNVVVYQHIPVPAFVKRTEVDTAELNLVMGVLESNIGQLEQEAKTSRHQFFQMMELIYSGSFYQGGPVVTEAAFPATSLALLYRFLHIHQNRKLLEDLKAGYRRVFYSQRQALPYFRDNLTRFYWDVFLRYFNFGRGGPLRVKVEVPHFESERSEVYPVVTIHNDNSFYKRELLVPYEDQWHAARALQWVLEALHLYATELGLWTEKSRTKRGRR